MNARPAIVAPVMRIIGVADAAQSAAFYRDILGFEVCDREGVTEAVSGPARIQFTREDYAPNEWEHPRPPGSAMLFFETDDVAAMHAAIRERGGHPSQIEKVNWIKMQMFAIRDPDGHTLWFGQSYHREHQPNPQRLLEKAIPNLPVRDVAAAAQYYKRVLGFKHNYQQEDLAVLDRDEVRLLLFARTPRHQGIGTAYFYVGDADALYAELRANGANPQGEPVSHPWGLRDFQVLDPDGNEIRFGQPFE